MWTVNAITKYEPNGDEYYAVKNSRNFTGKVVLVTGSTSGIGEGIAKLFAILGASVVVTGRRANEAQRVANDIQQLSPNKQKPLVVVADITKTEDTERLMNKTIEKFGQLDVLINNVGAGVFTTIRDDKFLDVYDYTFNANVRSGLKLIQLAVPYLELTNGTIIGTSSIASQLPALTPLPYGASKATLDFATRALAVELGPRIRVNAISPGFIMTEALVKLMPESVIKMGTEKALLKRVGRVADVAKAAVFLASTDAAFITGTNLYVDGGIINNI
ncbi:unnamed protein product [Medioppia subpectinata]|uniref:Uncharacterized protein n=1 Tax=Medioppia subpectinata TaxID=1979941 RepID=A0A7R9KM07_9ACAR|nr:unnamed protein product [Medioppia subpectinata]CAG2105969.1 unnamed protein product [Medioppia subpectinata]